MKKSEKIINFRPSREQAMEAVKTLLAYTGDDPSREGLVDTPKRVIKAYDEFFAGYKEDPVEVLSRTFEQVEGYDEMVIVKGIRVESHCEHHMVPIIGVAHVGYIPNKKVVGISKLARVANIFAKRMQVQEKLTAQIANCLQDVLKPRGVAVVIEAQHECMTTRGVRKPDVSMITTRFTGVFHTDTNLQRRFLEQARLG